MHHGGLLTHADRAAVRMVDRDLLLGPGLQHLGSKERELLRAEAQQDLGEQSGETGFERHPARIATRLGSQEVGQVRRGLLVRAVLQQPGEQQVAGLEQREVLLVLDVRSRQQPSRLEIEQGGTDDQELGGLSQVPGRAQGAQVADEVVGHLGQGHLGDIELVLADEGQEQVEGTLEHVQLDEEGIRWPVARVRRSGGGDHGRARLSHRSRGARPEPTRCQGAAAGAVAVRRAGSTARRAGHRPRCSARPAGTPRAASQG